MSVVAFYRGNEYVYAACDTRVILDDYFISEIPKKIFKSPFYSKFIIGGTGSYRYLLEIERMVKKENFLSGNIINKIIKNIKKLNTKENLQENNLEIIFSYDSDIYCIMNDFSYWKIKDDFFSIGIGSNFCFGAYEALRKTNLFYEKEAFLREIIRSSFPYCNSVGGEVFIEKYNYKI